MRRFLVPYFATWPSLIIISRVAFEATVGGGPVSQGDLTTTATSAPHLFLPAETAFTNAVLTVSEVTKLPRVERWTITAQDLIQQMSLTMDLAEHEKPQFAELWQLLSKGTQAQLLEKRAQLMAPHTGVYRPGPEIDAVVEDLNRLINGQLLFGGKPLASTHPSGDTLRLLALTPAGEQLARLNRLLLEDAFELDILRRPKLLVDPVSHKHLLVEFKTCPPGLKCTTAVLSLYDEHGTKLWSTDLTSSTQSKMRSYQLFRVPSTAAWGMNIGIWDVQFRGDLIAIKLMGREDIGVEIETGSPRVLYRW